MASPLDRDGGGAASLHASSASTAAANSTLLREQQAEREKLLMDNFNQALRINYLEERLLRVKQGTDFAGEDLESEVAQLRIALEEREHDIKQRNFAMIRATEAIDVLTGQLQAAKDENARLAGELELEHAAQQGAAHTKRERSAQADAELADEWRGALERAEEQTRAATTRARQLEAEVAQFEDAASSAASKAREAELERQKAAQQLDAAREQVEALTMEKEAVETRCRSRLKDMEEEVQRQMQRLREESEAYRVEHARLRTDREQTLVDRERLAREAESAKHERARLQTETERLRHELQQLAGDAERARLQSARLGALRDEQSKSLDELREERDKAAETIARLEGEARQWRAADAEHELRVKALEARVEHAERHVKTLEGQQTSKERLAALEQERHAIEQDNRELQRQLSVFQRELEALELQFRACEQRLGDETAKALACQSRAGDAEDALARREADVKELQRRLAERAQASSSSTETARLEQQSDVATRFATEKKGLLAAMDQERRRADAAEARHAALVEEMEAAKRELGALLGPLPLEERLPLVYLVRDGLSGVQRRFQGEMERLQARHEHKMRALASQLDAMSTRLAASQGQLETLQLSAVQSTDDRRSAERAWASKYESLRSTSEAERRAAQEEAQRLQELLTASETALARAREGLDKLARDRSTSRYEMERDYDALKESNRLLFDEVQERQRAAEHARKQLVRAVRENKELLKAIALYKKAVADREQGIEYYKGVLAKYAQQLPRRVSMGEVKQTLLEQLEQTQGMIHATYKRWSESDARDASEDPAEDEEDAVGLQLDEYIDRMERITERWGEFVAHAKELHGRYGDAWQSAVTRLGPSAGGGNSAGTRPPRWVEDVERKCARLLSESVRVSEAMRAVLDQVASAVQRERDERRQRGQRRLAASPRKPRASESDWREALATGGLSSDVALHDRKTTANQRSADAFASPVKPVMAPDGAGRRSTKQLAARLGAGVYSASLSSLGRLHAELESIDKTLRKEKERA